ncbi:hypothetical protein DMN91_010101 [Ooceraea biroi]|uniref:Uncharacterized protein n=1 Tax=Ooceraea biroi TaxID=2015173 RepID=A0A026W2W5_OOCBI|nr:uncharacterized protein LOC105283670 [Ooceraea biroi]XP_011344916.1 uncharacterized protein LOC105283670 [Ooceraea biroi]XP_011344917.1 uncharacterized protein LOC105283670 [Ooceraea biroi]XP_026829198.1 uncharacterized protein LOC105283670 [Ooceraea biroi]EZA50417.1 hypothetical protein X777_10610 [Ooceraea biroi]RLU17862.1 hypothetical protein DMN91_010101 [Ooceraea biroi]
MIGKQSHSDDDSEDSRSRKKLIADKRKFLEQRSAQIEAGIKGCFEELAKALRSREKQLLRQAEAIHRQQLSLVETSPDFLPSSIVVLDDRTELEEQIRRFGNIETHGSNSITVKDVEPYKVVDYQNANEDHVSFDKSITRDQGSKDHPPPCLLPRCKDLISDYRTLRVSSLPPTFPAEDRSTDSWNVREDALVSLKDTLSMSRCSPLLVIKRKLGLTHVSLDGLHAFDKVYPRDTYKMSRKTTESCVLDALNNEATETNLRQLGSQAVSGQDGSEPIAYPKEREKSYEHPIQVQHWLRQILAETEVEPAIHEIGQFSEISKAKLCNEL